MLQSGAVVSRRRVSRRALKSDPVGYHHIPSIRGRGAAVASAQAGAPQFIMRAGFGEAALVNMSKGEAYLIFL